jgi:flagellar hook assembly protein FlgD
VGGKLVGLPPGAIVHLLEPYPVPSSGKTRVEFIVAEPSHILFEVFDVKGRLIKEVADAKYGAGIHSISWDGTCTSGQLAAPGVYFLRCLAPNSQQVRRLVVVR